MRYISWVGNLPHSMGMVGCPSLLHFYPLWVLHLLKRISFLPPNSRLFLLFSMEFLGEVWWPYWWALGEIYSEPYNYNSGMDSSMWSEGMRKLLSHLIIISCEFFEKPHPLVPYKYFKHLGMLLHPHSVCGFSPIKPSCHLAYEAWGGNGNMT